MMAKVFLNDKLIEADTASISVTDSGFLYGVGLFETMRSHNGIVFALSDHLDRLFFSVNRLSINNPFDAKYLTKGIYEVLRANELTDARIRLTLTNGPMTETQQEQSTLLITAATFRPYPPEYYKNGSMVVLCPFRQNPNDPTCGHKTTSYFSRMIALNQAHQMRAAEALWFSTDNRLAEGCVSNVFLVKDSVLYTPRIETPVLAGIARKAICRMAIRDSMKLIEKDLLIDDVLGADEIFMTNVIMQVMPIIKVEKHIVGSGHVGPMAKDLKRKFEQLIETECCTSKE
ncbi:MAG: aminotransferase class IV family protein [Sedimentisphaerales bacterium]|nr:aminotransferase class IV family protein [Sedimentisphaerales bacterium]